MRGLQAMLYKLLDQWFSKRVTRNLRVPLLLFRGSAISKLEHFVLLTKYCFLYETNKLLYKGSLSQWNALMGFHSSKKVEKHCPR